MAGDDITTEAAEPQPASPDHPSLGSRMSAVAHRLIAIVVVLAALVGAYFLLGAFLPRWWAQQVGQFVGGGFSRSIGLGVLIGFMCTFLPILLIVFAVISRGRLRNVPAVACAVGAVIVAIPNLLTLAVVAGQGNGSHAGQRIFDVDAPGFRGATLGGAIGGAVVAALAAYFIWGYRRRGRKLRASGA